MVTVLGNKRAAALRGGQVQRDVGATEPLGKPSPRGETGEAAENVRPEGRSTDSDTGPGKRDCGSPTGTLDDDDGQAEVVTPAR